MKSCKEQRNWERIIPSTTKRILNGEVMRLDYPMEELTLSLKLAVSQHSHKRLMPSK